MSPLTVRRYRAERLLRREFEAMRGRVLGGVRSRLRAVGAELDLADLDACYAQAWHGLYTAMLEGDQTEIANPEGWLALVTYRRAIDEHRSRLRTGTGTRMGTRVGNDAPGHHPELEVSAPERDLAGELDDRTRLRQLVEGLRGRLSARERQAAALCYLQGLSRADAAARMGISEARMRKLMEGPRAGSPGVAGKVGELLDTIRAGSYCAEQSSLMRGFAFGILDPDGERYGLALAHQRECPACRAHVLSLRGLAAVLPPLPLPLALGAGAAAGAGTGATAGGTGAGAGAGTTAGVSGAGVSAGAGGGWLMAGGGLTAKLAVGCLVAVSVGAGCVALTIAPIAPRHAPHRRHVVHATAARIPIADEALSSSPVGAQLAAGATSVSRAGASGTGSADDTSTARLTPAARANREFGLEQPAHQPAHQAAVTPSSASHAARVASVGQPTGEGASAGGEASEQQARPAAHAHESGGPSAAEHEFGLG
jgi:DNA-directed RNA polymerase specialized sigma24 family protein